MFAFLLGCATVNTSGLFDNTRACVKTEEEVAAIRAKLLQQRVQRKLARVDDQVEKTIERLKKKTDKSVAKANIRNRRRLESDLVTHLETAALATRADQKKLEKPLAKSELWQRVMSPQTAEWRRPWSSWSPLPLQRCPTS